MTAIQLYSFFLTYSIPNIKTVTFTSSKRNTYAVMNVKPSIYGGGKCYKDKAKKFLSIVFFT